MSVLAAFGETRIHIESTNSPIRVTRAAKEQEAKDFNRQRVIEIIKESHPKMTSNDHK